MPRNVIDAEHCEMRKKAAAAYEARMGLERKKLAQAKASYRAAEAAFQKVQVAASAAHIQALKDADSWAREAKRKAQNTPLRQVSNRAKTIRSTKLHGARVSVPRVTCLEPASLARGA